MPRPARPEQRRRGSSVAGLQQQRRDAVRRAERQPVVAHQRVGQLGQRGPARRRRARPAARRRNRRRACAAATSVTVRVASRNIDATSGCRSSSVSTMSPNGVLWTAVHDRLRLPDRLAGDGARVLERHRIALLRHDAARPARSRRRAAGSRTPSCTTAAGPGRRGPGRRAAPRWPTRSRAGSPRSRCCRRCCRSGPRTRAARSCAAGRSGSRCR